MTLVAVRQTDADDARLCDLDLLASIENYQLWQRDHIILVSAGGPISESENLAVALEQIQKIVGWPLNQA